MDEIPWGFYDELWKIAKVVEGSSTKLPLLDGDREEFRAREAQAKTGRGDGCSLGRDAQGYYCYTHRTRSRSYERPGKIPLDRIKFVASTA